VRERERRKPSRAATIPETELFSRKSDDVGGGTSHASPRSIAGLGFGVSRRAAAPIFLRPPPLLFYYP